MGRRKSNDDGTPPPPKPKKLFTMEYVIWDDGEITNILKEVVYCERGAPQKWHVEGPEFVKAVNSTATLTTKDVLSAVLKSLEMSEEQLRRILIAKEKDNESAAAIGNAIGSVAKKDKKEDDDEELEFEGK